MGRRLDKIEKEMGYCEIKLEKEKRLRKQIELVELDLKDVKKILDYLSDYDGSLSAHRLVQKPNREAFLAAGLVKLAKDKRELLLREGEDLLSKLQHYAGFEEKKKVLDDEKKNVMRKMAPGDSSKMRRINEEFKKIERLWNQLAEDLINLDEGVFFLSRNLDYLKSCRNFLISAKGNYDIESLHQSGNMTDLFRHSSIGRALEMADGADRNLQGAQKELVCVSSCRVKAESFVRVLVPFMQALFEDLFEDRQIRRTVQVIEAALTANLKLLEQVKTKREEFAEKLEDTEKTRNDLFQRMGAKRRGQLTT